MITSDIHILINLNRYLFINGCINFRQYFYVSFRPLLYSIFVILYVKSKNNTCNFLYCNCLCVFFPVLDMSSLLQKIFKSCRQVCVRYANLSEVQDYGAHHHFQPEQLEDTKGVIRIGESKKDRQHNGQKKKDKRRSTMKDELLSFENVKQFK